MNFCADERLGEKQARLDRYFMEMAKLTAGNSHAEKAKVGAVLTLDNRCISVGWNGQPAGWDNCCEEKTIDHSGNVVLKTLPSVIHAEFNAICFCARNGIRTEGTTLYLTLSPCSNCALLLVQSGIKRVVYLEEYANPEKTGLGILKKAGIVAEKYEDVARQTA